MFLALILNSCVKTDLYSITSSYDFDDPIDMVFLVISSYLDLIEVKKVFFAHEIILHFIMNIVFEY